MYSDEVLRCRDCRVQLRTVKRCSKIVPSNQPARGRLQSIARRGGSVTRLAMHCKLKKFWQIFLPLSCCLRVGTIFSLAGYLGLVCRCSCLTAAANPAPAYLLGGRRAPEPSGVFAERVFGRCPSSKVSEPPSPQPHKKAYIFQRYFLFYWIVGFFLQPKGTASRTHKMFWNRNFYIILFTKHFIPCFSWQGLGRNRHRPRLRHGKGPIFIF